MTQPQNTSEQEQTNTESTSEEATSREEVIKDAMYPPEKTETAATEGSTDSDPGLLEKEVKEDIKEDETKEPPLAAEEDEKSDEAKASSEEKEGEDTIDYSEVKLSKDSLVSEEQLETILEYARKRELSAEDAKEVLSAHEEVLKGFQENQLKVAEQESLKQKQEIVDHPEFGGENLDSTVKLSQEALDRWFDKEDAEAIRSHPVLANSSGLIKALARIGKASKADSLHSGSPMNVKPKEAKDILYRNMPTS